jgi:hypothetical protein
MRRFLAANPGLPERLRWIVLKAADDLFRVSAAASPRSGTVPVAPAAR